MGREHNCLGGRCHSRSGLGSDSRGSELQGESSFNRGNRFRNGEDRAMLYPRPGATRDIVDSLLSQAYNGGMYGRNNYAGMSRLGDMGGIGQGDFGGLRGGGGLGGMGGMTGLGHDDLIYTPLDRRAEYPPGLRSPIAMDSPMHHPHTLYQPERLGLGNLGTPRGSPFGRQPMMSGALPGLGHAPPRSRLHSSSVSSGFDPYRMDRQRMPYGPEAGRRATMGMGMGNYRPPYVEDYESEMAEAEMAGQAMYGGGEGYFVYGDGHGHPHPGGMGMGGMGGRML
ncbi:hypothetical protein HYALB_00003002 [Hymenoscyphus albidus]|uniref:Uncharacterized protein n=1 Tax=Hymenoscyphus albidus TaxID=595503 RepID=A0A9N9Q8N2_9HELO|nr:hypothetical protein HYALB_00003002 [Hymenoscyphus albidus]